MQNSQRSATLDARGQDVTLTPPQVVVPKEIWASETYADQLDPQEGNSYFPTAAEAKACWDNQPLLTAFDEDCDDEPSRFYGDPVDHRDVTHCGHVDQGDGSRCYWQGACACGWLGERHGDTPNTLDNADLAHCDYRAHVVQELGMLSFYDASVACRNCGSKHIQPVVIGASVGSASCYRCGVQWLEPHNDAWAKGQATTRVWMS